MDLNGYFQPFIHYRLFAVLSHNHQGDAYAERLGSVIVRPDCASLRRADRDCSFSTTQRAGGARSEVGTICERRLMDCTNLRSRMGELLDVEIPSDELAAAQEHLQQCVECSRLYDKWIGVTQRFQSLSPTPVSREFDRRLSDKIDRVAHRPSLPNWVKVGAVAATLILVLLMTTQLGKPSLQMVSTIGLMAGLDHTNVNARYCDELLACRVYQPCEDLAECRRKQDRIYDWLVDRGM